MALWTDPSRQCLITSIRNRPVIWDKTYIVDSNYRILKAASFRDVTDELNRVFQMPVKFTCEDVRSQWKNLKDTFVRKLRWFHEGKYIEDALKEPTWKFYRMLTFLDDKEEKRVGDGVEHTYELAQTPTSSSGQVCHLKPDHHQQPHSSSMMQQISYEATSSEEQMLQMFNSQPSQQQGLQQSSTNQSGASKRGNLVGYSPNGSSSGVEEEEDDEDQPGRKKPFRRHTSATIQPMQVIHTPSLHQDEFDHFGAMVAATLRRVSTEQGRMNALRIQRRLYDALFLEE